jgi:hypothetical protein
MAGNCLPIFSWFFHTYHFAAQCYIRILDIFHERFLNMLIWVKLLHYRDLLLFSVILQEHFTKEMHKILIWMNTTLCCKVICMEKSRENRKTISRHLNYLSMLHILYLFISYVMHIYIVCNNWKTHLFITLHFTTFFTFKSTKVTEQFFSNSWLIFYAFLL